MEKILFVTWLGVVAAQIAPGPNFFAVASVALSQGRKGATYVAAGVATGVIVWAMAFAFGLSSLFNAFPQASVFLQLMGGIYLLVLAFNALVSAFRFEHSQVKAARQFLVPKMAYRRGLFVVLTNPKAALMWAAVAAFMLGSGLTWSALVVFAPIASLSAFIIYGSYGWLFSTAKAQQLYSKLSTLFECMFALMFGALGGKLLYESVVRFNNQ
ncbi:MAG: threonine efflux protein [Saprospiraceae bacterium]|jgi:threonine efflux protein